MSLRRARSPRQSFQQRRKELGPGEKQPPRPAALPRPALGSSEARPDQGTVPKSLLHPKLSPSPRHGDRDSSIPRSFGVPSPLAHPGASTCPRKGLDFVTVPLPLPQATHRCGIWLSGSSWGLLRDLPAALWSLLHQSRPAATRPSRERAVSSLSRQRVPGTRRARVTGDSIPDARGAGRQAKPGRFARRGVSKGWVFGSRQHIAALSKKKKKRCSAQV